MKALGFRPVESISLSNFWFSEYVNLHHYIEERQEENTAKPPPPPESPESPSEGTDSAAAGLGLPEGKDIAEGGAKARRLRASRKIPYGNMTILMLIIFGKILRS